MEKEERNALLKHGEKKKKVCGAEDTTMKTERRLMMGLKKKDNDNREQTKGTLFG